MKNSLLLWAFLLAASCQQEVAPTIENINTIFETTDFSINFIPVNGSDVTLSFREDYVTYKKGGATKRVTLNYEEVALINDFVQQQFKKHDTSRGERPSVIIYNDIQKVKMRVPKYGNDLKALLKKLPL